MEHHRTIEREYSISHFEVILIIAPFLFFFLEMLTAILLFSSAFVVALSIQHYNISVDDWNNQFRSGRWHYIDKIAVERARNSIIIGVFLNGLQSKQKRLLDVGCGEGTLSDFIFPEDRKLYTGVDVSDAALSLATKKRRLNFVKSSAEAFQPSPGQLFDVIVFNEMLYYVDHVQILKKFSKFLDVGGIIVISVWYTDKIDYLRASIFSDAAKLFKSIDSVDLKGVTGPGRQKKSISFHIEAFDTK